MKSYDMSLYWNLRRNYWFFLNPLIVFSGPGWAVSGQKIRRLSPSVDFDRLIICFLLAGPVATFFASGSEHFMDYF